MKRTIKIFSGIVLMVLAFSCKKSSDDPEQLSSAVFIHASPGTPTFQIYMDTLLQSVPTNSSFSLSYSSALTGATSFSSGYVGMIAGTHAVSLRLHPEVHAELRVSVVAE